MVYLITYDLNKTGQDYENVIKAIKDCSAANVWCSFWKSSYLIKSNLTANQILDKIKPYLDQNDKFLAVEANSYNYQGWLSEEQWKYVNSMFKN